MTVQEPLATPHAVRLKVKDYLLLAESGAFDDYARSELIEGEIWVVNAIHRLHARAHAHLTVEIGMWLRTTGSSLTVYTAPSTELSDDSLPEPDIILSEPGDAKTLLGPEVRLAIEISDSSLDFDLRRKARLYARYGIPEYWVVDIENWLIHQMWRPSGEAYDRQERIAFGSPIDAATIGGLTIDTAGL